MRINRFLAHCGIGSRRTCDKLVKHKKVKVNNRIIEDFSYIVKTNDFITVENKELDNY